MHPLLEEIRHNPLLWLLVFVPVLFACEGLRPDAHILLFFLSILGIAPLAGLLSRATEAVAARTGDAVGGLLNATLGNMTELIITLTALGAGQHQLVKASMAGVIVTNTLFMLGASFFLGGLKFHTQEYNPLSARLYSGLLMLATVALLVPSAVSAASYSVPIDLFLRKLSFWLSLILLSGYGLGLLFSLGTHREYFGGAEHADAEEIQWPLWLSLATLAVVTILVALVSEVFVESITDAAPALGMTQAFVGFIVVGLLGGAAEMVSAFAGARRNRLDLSVGIALGSATQIALFVAPVLVLTSYFIGPYPMDLRFGPGVVIILFLAVTTISMLTESGRSAWFVGVLMVMVYLIFAVALYLMPPRAQEGNQAAAYFRKPGEALSLLDPELWTVKIQVRETFFRVKKTKIDRAVVQLLKRGYQILPVLRPDGANGHV